MSETHPSAPSKAEKAEEERPRSEVVALPDAPEGAADADAADGAEEQHTRGRLLPFPFARRFGVAIVDPCNESGLAEVVHRTDASAGALLEVRRFAGRRLKLSEIDGDSFETVIASTYARDSSEARQMVADLGDEMDLASLADSVPETEDLLEQEDDAPIIRLINALLAEAIRESASDIHIETFEKTLVVRFRVDGILREIVQPKRALAPLLVSRIKVMARLDIAEKRIPQDGRISLKVAGREVDVRVSTMPSANGERVVLRLLDKQAGRLQLDALGMDAATLGRMRELLVKPHGILLVTGPTGSGKTTTLYASMGELDSNAINILTVEDPIEYNLAGIGQTQVNVKAEMTFAIGLRAILRQDPDVVMVGEIRDMETADIAVQASLTGHTVLSTLHTNTAVGAVTRLDDMGVEPFLLSSSLIGVLAQRLVRVLCPACRIRYRADKSECDFLGVDVDDPPMLYRAGGCIDCAHSGYRGRTGIYELVIVDDAMRELIHERVGEQQLARHARQTTPSIRDDGRQKVLACVTSVAEVLRVTRED